MSRWSQYVQTHLVSSQKELADRAGVNAATLSRWIKEQVPPSPEQVIAFARGVRVPPVQALVMAGYITPEEARMTVSDIRIEDVEDVVLLDELRRRAVIRAQTRSR